MVFPFFGDVPFHLFRMAVHCLFQLLGLVCQSLVCFSDLSFHYVCPMFVSVTWLSMSVLGALSCAAGDTFASEFGTVLGNGETILITNGQKVPKGRV